MDLYELKITEVFTFTLIHDLEIFKNIKTILRVLVLQFLD